MFSHIQNIGPSYEPLTDRGSLWNYVENRSPPHFDDFGKPRIPGAGSGSGSYGSGKWNHTGFAGACRKSAWDNLGGLIDWAILGSADYHMAAALVGNVGMSLNRYSLVDTAKCASNGRNAPCGTSFKIHPAE
jgi:hypothetical protein